MFVGEKQRWRSGRKGEETPEKENDRIRVQTPILQGRVLGLHGRGGS